MALTKRQIITTLSVLYLIGLTILAASALHSAHVYSLPIDDITCALTLALPPLAGIALETVISLNNRLAAKGQLQTSRVFQVTIVFFIIYEAVLATLAGQHVFAPSGCALRERWQALFHRKDAESVQRIQDAFRCCGLGSTSDMAFPFPDKRHGADACVVRYDRDQACLGAWRGEERKVAIMLLVVPVAVFVWKILILLAPSSSSAWLPSKIRLPSEHDSPAAANRRPHAIAYRDLEDTDGQDSLHDEVARLNNDSNMASRVEGGRARPSNLWREHERWRDGAAE